MAHRNLAEVIDAMLAVIPDGNHELVLGLKYVQDSSRLAAPEMQYMWWNEVYDILNETIGVPTLDWHHKLGRIFSGVPND